MEIERWALFVKLPNGDKYVTPHECTWLEIETYCNRMRILNARNKYRYTKLGDKA